MTTISITETLFTPNGFSFPTAPAGTTSLVVALPTNASTTPSATLVKVTNLTGHAFVALGDETVSVAAGTGSIITTTESRTFEIGTATHIAFAIQSDGQNIMIETGN